MSPGVREVGALAGHRGRGDDEADSALTPGARWLQKRGGVLDGISVLVLVPTGGDEQDVPVGCIVDGALLDDRAALAADAEIDDFGAVVDRVDDRGRLVDLGEHAVLAARLDDEELRVAAEPCDAFVVGDGARGERGDEGPVAVQVTNVGPLAHDVPGLRALGGEIGMAQVGAGVDDRDLDAGGCAQNRVGHFVGSCRHVLPLVRKARAEEDDQRRLGVKAARPKAVHEGDPWERGDTRCEMVAVHLRVDGDRAQLGQPLHDPCGEFRQRLAKGLLGAVADDDLASHGLGLEDVALGAGRCSRRGCGGNRNRCSGKERDDEPESVTLICEQEGRTGVGGDPRTSCFGLDPRLRHP